MSKPEELSKDQPRGGGWVFVHFTKIICAHILLFAVALFLSFTLDSGMKIGAWFPATFFWWLVVVLVVKLIVFGFLHQYHGWWRYASVADLFSIMLGAHISAVILVMGWYGAYNIVAIRDQMGPLTNVPQTVMLLDWAATIAVFCGVRLAIRLYHEETQAVTRGGLARILIVGAGNAGESLLREIRRMTTARYDVVGYVDDNPQRLGFRIHGVAVLGATTQIKEIAQKHNVDEIVIAMPSASHKQLRRVIEHCQGANLQFSIVPDLMDIASGKVSVSQMREIDIHDLLGRDPVTLDIEAISEFIRDKVVMITGAGGSIGSEMCHQVSHFLPKSLLLVEQAENSLFFVERELRRDFPDAVLRPLICDITDGPRVDRLFDQFRPEVVIHAAAHKHVPLMEENPGEAVKNNIVGTRTIAQAADRYGVNHFVMISTDKAVNPTSIMGSCKRIAEMGIQCLNERSKTDFITVRFGNVLGSNGSVIPIFRKQIANGGPVTVTHPEMVRYFMTIPEASQLVLQAATIGHGGEILLLDMGEPVKIVDLARDLITLSGFRPDEDIEIQFVGMRPGEKLFEELAITGEDMQSTRHPKISIWKKVLVDEGQLNMAIEKLLSVADQPNNRGRVIELIKSIVPEYVGDIDSIELKQAHTAQNGNGAKPEPAQNMAPQQKPV